MSNQDIARKKRIAGAAVKFSPRGWYQELRWSPPEEAFPPGFLSVEVRFNVD